MKIEVAMMFKLSNNHYKAVWAEVEIPDDAVQMSYYTIYVNEKPQERHFPSTAIEVKK